MKNKQKFLIVDTDRSTINYSESNKGFGFGPLSGNLNINKISNFLYISNKANQNKDSHCIMNDSFYNSESEKSATKIKDFTGGDQNFRIK